ncbi:hypothetical protein SEPCBS57363_006054 [Sporothrix epigloea]|uniref:Uncharacterized protein n=1 Tax=Sporothrix epigloea TaxID=1892477 RepID=A0ABP0E2V4_9PEZI
MGACNLPELLALDLETADSVFATRRMDVINETKSSIQDLYQANQSLGMDLDLDLRQVNSILAKAAALAYVSPRTFSPPPTASAGGEGSTFACVSPSLEPSADDKDASTEARSSLRPRNSSRRRDRVDQARPMFTTHPAVSSSSSNSSKALDSNSDQRHRQRPPVSPSHLYASDPYRQPRPTSATSTSDRGDDGRYSLGSIVSISRTKSKSSTPSSSQVVTPIPSHPGKTADSGVDRRHTGEWDTSSVDSFELPNISLSRRDDKAATADISSKNSVLSLPTALSAPSVHQRIRLQEEERLLQLQQLQQLRQLQQLQQQLAKQLQLQLHHEQTLKGTAKSSTETDGPLAKELLPDCDKAAQDHLREEPSSYPFAHYSDGDRRDSCGSYGSLCDSCSYNHDDDTDNNVSDCSLSFRHSTSHRHSSGGMTMLSSVGVRGRQQSVVTTATSVTSSGAGRRFSSQSRALSAVGRPTLNAKGSGGLRPSSQCASRASSMGGAPGSGAGSDRHVEFRINGTDKDSVRDDNNSIKAKTASSLDRDDVAVSSSIEDIKGTILTAESHNLRNADTVHDAQSSWMRFDDDDDEDEDEDDDQQEEEEQKHKGYTKIDRVGNAKGTATQRQSLAIDVTGSSFDVAAFSHDSLPPRPQTSAGHFQRGESPDFGVANERASKTTNRFSLMPAISCSSVLSQRPHQQHQIIAVPRRHSSLGHRALADSFGQRTLHSHQQLQQLTAGSAHRLRHLDLSLSDASIKTSNLARQAFNGGSGLFSFYDRPKTSLSSHGPLQVSTRSGRTSEAISTNISTFKEPLVFSQRAIYCKPAPAAAVLEMVAVAGRRHATRLNSITDKNHGQNVMLAKPSPIRQFGDDNDHDRREGRAEYGTDLDLFGDFEGAYNYNEGEDQIMMATAMPFSKQNLPPRSLDSIRPHRPHSSYQPRESTLEQPAYYAGSERAECDNLNKPTSHLQSWIEHASRNQQELIHQQQCQQFDLSPMTSVFYEDDLDEAGVGRESLDDQSAAALQNEAGVPEARLSAEICAHGQAPASMPVADTPTATVINSTCELQTAPPKAQLVPLLFFSQPGTVGIPLPREVVDTLRVSVSCFPETMLSLSSFSIQTIRSYSRKVRRCSQSDADDAYRLLMAPFSPSTASPPTRPPSPTATGQYFPLTPASPAAGPLELGTGVTRSTTALSLSANGTRRFWKLHKKVAGVSVHNNNDSSRSALPALNMFTGFRSSTSSNGSSLHSPGYQLSPTSTGHSTPRMSTITRRGTARPDMAEDDRSKANGLCLKRIFPTGSDYLCDALYAHIIAFNYISLLCPPLPDVGFPAASEVSAAGTLDSSADACESNLSFSTTHPERAGQHQRQRRQNLRIHVESDASLPLAELDDIHMDALATADDSYRLSSLTSSRPPSREILGSGSGHGNHDNEDGRMISRKAALLLGISETLEPDGRSSGSKKVLPTLTTADNLSLSGSHSNGIARRYNSMRRRHHLRMNHSISESTAAASKMFKRALPGGGNSEGYNTNNKARTGKSVHETVNVTSSQASDIPASATTTPLLTPTSTPTSTASATAAALDSWPMRDLHAGLHACISQLVATMKLTTGQLGSTLLSEDVVREIDPLFLRTLCELVRSQEEQF